MNGAVDQAMDLSATAVQTSNLQGIDQLNSGTSLRHDAVPSQLLGVTGGENHSHADAPILNRDASATHCCADQSRYLDLSFLKLLQHVEPNYLKDSFPGRDLRSILYAHHIWTL
jgi:hypothetical protein